MQKTSWILGVAPACIHDVYMMEVGKHGLPGLPHQRSILLDIIPSHVSTKQWVHFAPGCAGTQMAEGSTIDYCQSRLRGCLITTKSIIADMYNVDEGSAWS